MKKIANRFFVFCVFCLSMMLFFPAVSAAAGTAIIIYAKGTVAGGVWPHMRLLVNGAAVKDWNVENADYKPFAASLVLNEGENRFSVVFDNNSSNTAENRNLYIDYLKVGGVRIDVENSCFGTVVYKVPSYKYGLKVSQHEMNSNGSLDFKITYEKGKVWDICAAYLRNFFRKINLDYPGLAAVKGAVNGGDYILAETEFVNYLKKRTLPKYFFNAADKQTILDVLDRNENFAGYKESILAAANKSINHIFTDINFNAGADFDWDSIIPNDSNSYIEKTGWLPELARAYWISGDEKFAKEFSAVVKDWIKDNPRPNKVVWSTLNTSSKTWAELHIPSLAANWIEAYSMILNSGSISRDVHIRFVNQMWEFASYLEAANNEAGNSVRNHYIVQLTGIADIGIMFPEFGNSSHWRNFGFSGINRHLSEGVLDDGGYIEMTSGYHDFVVDSLLDTFLLARLNGYEGDLDTSRYKKMFLWEANIKTPNNKLPLIGDGHERTVGGTLAKGALLFDDPAMKIFDSYKFPKEYIWRFGKIGLEKFNSFAPPISSAASVRLPDSQFFVLKSGEDKNSNYLMFDCAPFGEAQINGHSHNHSDALNVAAMANGKNLLIDTGSVFYGDPLISYYQSARAHNLIVFDGKDFSCRDHLEQPKHDKPFVTDWVSSPSMDFAGCSYASVAESMSVANAKCLNSSNLSGPKHTRKILFAKPNYWIVSDLVEGVGRHKLDLLYHPADYEANKYDIISLDKITPQKVTEFLPAGTSYTAVIGSPYLKFTKASVALPATFSTLIYPNAVTAGITSAKLAVKAGTAAVVDTAAQGFKIDIAKENATDYFLISHATPASRAYGSIAFDGQTAYLRETNGVLSKVDTVNGGNLKYGDFSLTISNGEANVTWPNDSAVLTTICKSGIAEIYVNSKKISSFDKEGDCFTFTVQKESACVPTCTTANAKQCNGNGVQTCAMSGGCLRWSTAAACPTNQTCTGGICFLTCTSECAGGAKQCDGTIGLKTCAAANGCFKWGATTNCPTGQICSGAGACAVPNCVAKTCASLGNYECGGWNDGCGGSINCGVCESGKTCNTNGRCVSSGGGGSGSGSVVNPLINPIVKMTRAEIIAKINEIVALIAKLQEQLKAMTGEKYSCVQITKVLRYGMQNDLQVKCLQEVLEAQGYAVVVSGNYDLATKSAVKMFQGKNAKEILAPYGLRAGSGNAGNATLGKINMLIAGG